jgi:choice-of-anchor B domain-containing protein
MQIFDLTQLRNVNSPPIAFSETANYNGFDIAHNIAINQDTGYAYVVGTELYDGGPYILDLSDPIAPVHVGGFGFDGYTHDTQVVVYHGTDVEHFGKEIAFNSNTDELTIVDFTDKSALNSTQIISKSSYASSGYVHQGWLTEDHRYFLSNDELDELNNNVTTRTHLWDLADLDAPGYMGFYDHGLNSIDHNLYIVGDFAFEANYTTGLRVLDLSEIASGILSEVAYIDTHPSEDSNTSFDGAWSAYPFFSSGTILIGDRNEGLVIVEFAVPEPSVVGLLCLGGFWGLQRRN